MSTRAFQFLRDLAHEREEEAIETTPLFARGREFGTPGPLRQHMLRTTYQEELQGEALELAPLFSRTDLREFEKSPTTRKSLRSFTVECQFWSSPSGRYGSGELSDGFVETRIVIWDGRGTRMLFPPKDKQNYVDSPSVNGLIVSPRLSGIQSDEITVMAGVRFGGSGGQEHYIVGVFPLPDSDPFRLTAYVEYATKSFVVRARDIDAAAPKAQAKLFRETKLNKAMLGGTLVTRLDRPGSFRVDVEHYSGKMRFGPTPTALLGKR